MRFVPKFHESIIIKLILFTLAYFPLIFIAYFENAFDEMELKNFLYMSMGVYIFTVTYAFISWLILNIVEKKFVYEKETENYYRDIIKNISPSQLSYIDDYGIETKKDIVASILMLHLKGRIKISNNKIEFISKYKTNEGDYYNISKSEAAVLECISNGKSPLKIKNKFERLLMEDLLDDGLIEEKNTVPPHFHIKMALQFIYGILLLVIALITKPFISKILYAFGPLIIVYTLIWWATVVSSEHSILDKDYAFKTYHKLTKKGDEIRLKLTGLKLFLRNYSNMNKKSLKEIELWDEYMIYSVILNDNKVVQDTIVAMIKRQFK